METKNQSEQKDDDHILPEPPFWGKRVIQGIPLPEITPFLNKPVLFSKQWNIKRSQLGAEEFQDLVNRFLEPKFQELTRYADKMHLLQPRVVYGYFRCQSQANQLWLFEEAELKSSAIIFEFPRQKSPPNLCLADYFLPFTASKKDAAALMVVTMGEFAADEARRLYQHDEYQQYLFWHGLAVAYTEALSEYWHQVIRRELNIIDSDSPKIRQLFGGHYQGARYAPGYPAWPNLSDQQKIFHLLDPETIGVTLTENFQMVPEYSSSAIIVHHPEAKYFSI
jgi:5-methyltetrahydrofolate--homocysteine methyltransferase